MGRRGWTRLSSRLRRGGTGPENGRVGPRLTQAPPVSEPICSIPNRSTLQNGGGRRTNAAGSLFLNRSIRQRQTITLVGHDTAAQYDPLWSPLENDPPVTHAKGYLACAAA